MMYVIQSNLQVVLFFVCFIVKSYEKIFLYHLDIGCIIVYCTTIISNILDKVAHDMELWIVKSWSI